MPGRHFASRRRFDIGTAASTLLGCLAAAALFTASLRAQGPMPVTFAAMLQADSDVIHPYQIEQIRRIRVVDHEQTTWIAMLESLRTGHELVENQERAQSEVRNRQEYRYELRLNGVLGELPQVLSETRRDVFRSHAAYLHEHGSFRIDDAELAARNYTMVFLQTAERAHRPVYRVVLVPHHFGCPFWLLDVDTETSYPLYRGEFDFLGQLISELEVTSFAAGNGVPLEGWNKPRMRVLDFDNVVAALGHLNRFDLLVPGTEQIPPGFRLQKVRIVQETINPERSLVLTYTDGIDKVFFVATPNALPSAATPTASYRILEYRDSVTAQYWFQPGVDRFLLVGRSTQPLLRGSAISLLSIALTSR